MIQSPYGMGSMQKIVGRYDKLARYDLWHWAGNLNQSRYASGARMFKLVLKSYRYGTTLVTLRLR